MYISAFIISVMIFLSGFYFATLVEENVKLTLKEKLERINEGSILFQIVSLTDYDPSYCDLYREALLNSYEDVDAIGRDLTYLEEVKGERNIELKKMYFLFELKTALLTEKVAEVCRDNVSVVLYIYSRDCQDCPSISNRLTELRKKGDSLKVFSFEDGIGSTVVESLKKEYFVVDIPTIILNGKKIEIDELEEAYASRNKGS